MSAQTARHHGGVCEPEELLAAARAAYEAGYRKMDAYSPYAVEGVAEAIGFHKTRVPLIMLLGGICGALTAYGMQWYSAVIDYRLNVGGRPPHSWPAFVPITFELTVLFAAIAGVIGMLAMNGLPQTVSSGFQRAGVQARQPDALLPLHRGARSVVSRRRSAGISSAR